MQLKMEADKKLPGGWEGEKEAGGGKYEFIKGFEKGNSVAMEKQEREEYPLQVLGGIPLCSWLK